MKVIKIKENEFVNLNEVKSFSVGKSEKSVFIQCKDNDYIMIKEQEKLLLVFIRENTFEI